MNEKGNILEAWIMVEHLSEGDINLRDKTIKTMEDLEEEDYYRLFSEVVRKNNLKKYKKSGIVVYFDVFSFGEVIEFLRKEYHLSSTDEEISVGDKFSIALYFDNELKLLEKMSFFTESYYIRKNKKIPRESEFKSFEGENKNYISELFECPEGEEYETFFNSSVKKMMSKYSIDVKECRMKALTNVETDETNLHSFFVSDLEKAKSIKTGNLDAYLLGKTIKRVDLDSKNDSEKFNPEIFDRVLQPKKYPVSRFPSNMSYALSFMQQIAVNLSIGYDTEQIRSVNGPPGTGKTTLLKDIFAELVVDQAMKITELNDKKIKGSEKTKYYQNASIGQIPDDITEKSIVVASSNNGAVQNIVNELPLIKELDETLVGDIIEADYFHAIANSKVSSEWVEGENGKKSEELSAERNEGEDKFWGLFSLEGGKKDNMTYIITVLKHVVKYLEDEYIPDDGIYGAYRKQYEEVSNYRENVQRIADAHNKYNEYSAKLNEKNNNFDAENRAKEKDFLETNERIEADIKMVEREITRYEESMQESLQHHDAIQREKESIEQCIQALTLQKPGFFSGRAKKTEYKQKQENYSNRMIEIIEKAMECREIRADAEREIKRLEGNKTARQKEIEKNNRLLSEWKQALKDEISNLESQTQLYKNEFISKGKEIKPLDMNVDYDRLQMSDPWFDAEYRKLQSRLFITALKVRKQFLYDNRQNVKAAAIIWNKQNDYLDKKNIIIEAWNWINMVVPVISSTFASFSRMCANFDREVIGHLFVDEAGQALPQASVGAVFRSRHVMVVGDPSQIKPVLTLDSSILRMLGEHFGVSEKYLSESASTQTLVDAVSQYGFYKDSTKETWIGIPLWVHRRCQYPMFDISNKISYNGYMVQGVEKYGKSEWYDVSGNATDKYVREQGDFLREKISELIKQNPDILDKSKKDIIYVISPFKNVAFHLSQELKKINFTRYDKKGKPENVGTIHTFQGKEAPIVFMVMGADSKSTGAANWAVSEPNMMNVAVTRAKEEFYIIGDKKLYMSLNSDVVNDTYNIIRKFNSKD